jgi:hypothetical protein
MAPVSNEPDELLEAIREDEVASAILDFRIRRQVDEELS